MSLGEFGGLPCAGMLGCGARKGCGKVTDDFVIDAFWSAKRLGGLSGKNPEWISA